MMDAGIEWFLTRESPTEMYSVTCIVNPGVPLHVQFHHWKLLKGERTN